MNQAKNLMETNLFMCASFTFLFLFIRQYLV